MLYAEYIIITPDFRRNAHKLLRYLSTTQKMNIPYSVYENLTSHITTIFTRCNLISRKVVTTRTENVSTFIRKFYSRVELNTLYKIHFCVLFNAESVSLQT
jgi:hypothetical protein